MRELPIARSYAARCSVDSRTPTRPAKVLITDGKLAAGSRAVRVMPASPCCAVEPQTRDAIRWQAVRSTSALGTEHLSEKAGTVALEVLPRLLAVFVENAQKPARARKARERT
jgi:hypothetical protein